MTTQVTLGSKSLDNAIGNFAAVNNGAYAAAANTLATLLNSNPLVVNQLNTAFANYGANYGDSALNPSWPPGKVFSVALKPQIAIS